MKTPLDWVETPNTNGDPEKASKTTQSPHAYESFGIVFYTALFVFLCVVVSFGILRYLVVSTHAEIANKRDEISKKSQAIDTLRSDRRILGYSYYSGAKAEIEANIRNGEAQRYVAEMRSVEDLYHLSFVGFGFDKDRVSTTASADRGDGTGAIDKIIHLTKDYRDNHAHLFSLDPIYSVGGDSGRRTFSVGFWVNKDILARQVLFSWSMLTGGTIGAHTVSGSMVTSVSGSTVVSGIPSLAQ